MHPTKRVHYDNFQIYTEPMQAMLNAVRAVRLSITLRVMHSSGQAELACPSVF